MRGKVLFLLLFVQAYCYSKEIATIKSPQGSIKVIIEERNGLRYSVYFRDQMIIAPSVIDLNIEGKVKLKDDLTIRNKSIRNNNSIIINPIPEKRKHIPDHYRELTIRFKQPYSLEIRVYDDGVAYRWKTHFKRPIVVKSETAKFNLNKSDSVWYSAVQPREGVDMYHTSFEEQYQTKPVDSVLSSDLIFTPTLISASAMAKVVVTESDLEDYPGMFLRGTKSTTLEADFAAFPLEEKITEGEFPQAIVTRRADYIAKTKGDRSFPWRVILIAKEDKELPVNDLVYRLASQSRVKDASWIKPGKGTDEWIIGINLFNVPFKAGINTATYKYYIDFAKRFGFDRIMMDAGWSNYKDLFKINPDLNMKELTGYAKSKGVKLSMWTLSIILEKQLEAALDQFNEWGVDFIMTDFMDRDDQKMVEFYHKIAEACARHKIMVMFHGAFKPAGFNRTWPNAVTREGVLGSEFNIWSDKATPEHNVQLPFIRMTSGPLDYEPGLLDNATRKTFRPIDGKVMSQGTRCHQLAMFVVYDSPMQLFSGNPSQGLQEPEFMELLGSIPTTWDTTLILQGKVGDYIVTARKKGNDWFIGAMTDWTSRTLSLNLDFLDEGSYEATICEDGINADRSASDYKITKRLVSKKDSLNLHLAPGGGYLVRITLSNK